MLVPIARSEKPSWSMSAEVMVTADSEFLYVAFRAYDSDRVAKGEPFWTPHSAFVDPTVPADAPARESLEMRAICLFLGD